MHDLWYTILPPSLSTPNLNFLTSDDPPNRELHMETALGQTATVYTAWQTSPEEGLWPTGPTEPLGGGSDRLLWPQSSELIVPGSNTPGMPFAFGETWGHRQSQCECRIHPEVVNTGPRTNDSSARPADAFA